MLDDNKQLFEINVTDGGVPIQRSEVEAAVKPMKKGQAIGMIGLVVEMVEALEDWGFDVMMQLENRIYDTGHIPTHREMDSHCDIQLVNIRNLSI